MFVAGFIGSPRMNFLNAVAKGSGRFEIAGTAMEQADLPSDIPAGGEFVVGIRPEHILVAGASGGSIEAKVDFFEYLGGTRYIYCVLADGQNLVVEQRSGDDLRPGSTIGLDLSSKQRLFFDSKGERLGA